MAYKSGFVAIIGRPNVGKSTLLNKILGQKVAITSDKAQTTRKRLRGIYTSDKGQIIFVDTPGIHKPLHKLGEYLLDEAKFSIPDADVILFLVDGSQKAGPSDKWIVENVLQTDLAIIMIINKVDLVKSIDQRDINIASYKDLFGEKSVPSVKISAKTGRNIDTLVDNIYRKLPKGPQYFPEEDVTDQSLRVIAGEIVREGILVNTHEEIPHSVAVTVDEYKEKENVVSIMATIYVEHDSQKGIIIGEKGSMLKRIGTESRIGIEKLVEKKVFLELFVKVKKDWRKKDTSLKEFGYYSK